MANKFINLGKLKSINEKISQALSGNHRAQLSLGDLYCDIKDLADLRGYGTNELSVVYKYNKIFIRNRDNSKGIVITNAFNNGQEKFIIKSLDSNKILFNNADKDLVLDYVENFR